MKYIINKLVMAAACAAVCVGCNLNINEDPNRVTETTITGQLIFPAAAHEVGQRVASANFTFLNNWLGYWAASGSFAIDATETTYNIGPNFGNALWVNHYNAMFDLEKARSKAIEEGDTLTAAASMIMLARLYQDVVDIFGDVPYSQAFQFAKYPQPAYDHAQDIYNDLQVKLDQAIAYMALPGLSSFASIDIVNHGDKTKWIKFANTLKLRLLIRQSEVPGFDPTAELAKIQANGGVLQAGESVTVNPGYSNAVNKQSPFYANYGLTVNNAEAAPSVRANEYFVQMLTNNADPRLAQYFLPVNGVVVGNVYGLASGNPLVSSGIGSGLANNAAQDQWILTSVESLFLEAEAIERGWLPGTASTKYDEAVTESFTFLRVSDPATAASDYLTSFPYVAGAGAIDNLILQKYISMCGIAPLESWSDLRRLGYGIIPPGYISVNPGAVSSTIPVRLPYAQNEYTTNADAVGAEGTIDVFASRIFWDVN